MKKLLIMLALTLMLGLVVAGAAEATPYYPNRCSGCSARYYDHYPSNSYYYNSYSYGYHGWGDYKVHYSFKYPYYRHYYSYNWHYPYAYNYYPRPMYHGPWGTYGPSILW